MALRHGRKVVSNHRRSLRRRRRLADRLHTDLPRLIPAADEGPDVDAVGAAFTRLTPDDQDLLILVGWEGLDPGQLAAVLGCTRATARVRLHRARTRFLRALEEGVQRNGAVGHEPRRWATARPGTEETL